MDLQFLIKELNEYCMKKRENSIVIIIPYFGKWPAWFEYFLLSCSYNSSVDWLLFTDCGKPAEIYENTRFIDFTLDEFNKLASQKTGIEINIKNPYKFSYSKLVIFLIIHQNKQYYL